MSSCIADNYLTAASSITQVGSKEVSILWQTVPALWEVYCGCSKF